MQRRNFLKTLAVSSVGSLAIGGASNVAAASCGTNTIPSLEFYSSSSLLDANFGALTDDSLVSVWAEETATNNDADGNGDAYLYGDATPIPLVATDTGVVGFGSVLVSDADVSYEYGNEEFVLNVWDDELGGSGTVLWDEGHGQYYTLAKSAEFESYAENNGYTVTATTTLASDLGSADAAVITSPAEAFTTSELNDLATFVSNGGTLFLHDQSDYNDYDGTSYLNDVVDAVGGAFRFNDDEVLDTSNNAGDDYKPITDEFNTSFPYFTERSGLGLEAGEVYDVTITSVTDGDTFDVEFSDGSTGEVRVLGIDTPETKRNSKYERVYEWEGIEDDRYLSDWGGNAKDYAKAELDGKNVDLFFDENEPVRDAFGRLLAYVRYDATGDGNRDTLYNEDIVAKGYARVYDSGLSKHAQILQAEQDARANGRRVWQQSDPANSSEIRDRAVDDIFFPVVSSIRTDSGAVADSRVPVYAESTATQQLDGGVSYSDIPLVAVDEGVNTAMVGGLVIDEAYESDEGFGADTSGFENFVFLTNLIDYLADRSGDVLIDGGHGQFGHEYSLSAEDAAYYLRYLEGQGGIPFEGVNTISSSSLSNARALIVTSPVDCYTSTELDALSSFNSDGGAVILMGSAETEDLEDAPRAHFNDVAAGIGSDLRLNDDQIVDDSNNVNSDSEIPYTTTFDGSFPLFNRYS
ncbi:DUF4350 domain-containing protein [Haladaptatus sp. NG-SE-30]